MAFPRPPLRRLCFFFVPGPEQGVPCLFLLVGTIHVLYAVPCRAALWSSLGSDGAGSLHKSRTHMHMWTRFSSVFLVYTTKVGVRGYVRQTREFYKRSRGDYCCVRAAPILPALLSQTSLQAQNPLSGYSVLWLCCFGRRPRAFSADGDGFIFATGSFSRPLPHSCNFWCAAAAAAAAAAATAARRVAGTPDPKPSRRHDQEGRPGGHQADSAQPRRVHGA